MGVEGQVTQIDIKQRIGQNQIKKQKVNGKNCGIATLRAGVNLNVKRKNENTLATVIRH
jgi:hypothetical protein